MWPESQTSGLILPLQLIVPARLHSLKFPPPSKTASPCRGKLFKCMWGCFTFKLQTKLAQGIKWWKGRRMCVPYSSFYKAPRIQSPVLHLDDLISSQPPSLTSASKDQSLFIFPPLKYSQWHQNSACSFGGIGNINISNCLDVCLCTRMFKFSNTICCKAIYVIFIAFALF